MSPVKKDLQKKVTEIMLLDDIGYLGMTYSPNNKNPDLLNNQKAFDFSGATITNIKIAESKEVRKLLTIQALSIVTLGQQKVR